MQNAHEESDLWQRARRNDGEAFGTLFDLHRGRVYRRALGLLRSAHDADEVTAAAFFELWRRRASVQLVSGSVLPWLLVATVNLSRNVHRSTARYRRLLATLPRERITAGPDLEQYDTRDRLVVSLRALSPDDGALFVLTALEGLSITEAAQTLGLKPATARVRLHRARARLRDELHDLGPGIRPTLEGNAS